MLRVKLNETKLKELEERLKRAKSQNTLIYLDLKIIEFSHQGKSVSQISALLGLNVAIAHSGAKSF
ncbi:MAG: hypothetical protein KJ077_51405 [Anaerolineae bacterium]|nr:hypothetical protein [Anaerolineae bacterium]